MNSPFINRWFLRSIWPIVVPDNATVPVTLSVRTAPGAAFTNYSLTHAKRRPAGRKTDNSPAIAHETLSWLIWQDDLDAVSAPTPKVADKITDGDGVSWVIQDVESHLLDEVWHVNTVRAR